MIATTIDSLLTIKPILQKLANTSMSAKEAFQVLKMLKLIDKEYESIETVQKQMLNKYGDKDEDGCFNSDEKGNFIIKKELINDYVKEMQIFLNEKVELNYRILLCGSFVWRIYGERNSNNYSCI